MSFPGEHREALGGPCTQHGIEAGGVAAWVLWASRHSCTPLGQHQEPTPGKQVGQTGRRGVSRTPGWSLRELSHG